MSGSRRGAWFLAMGFGLGGLRAAQETYGEARAALFHENVAQVEALVDWCQERRLYLERDRLCEALLSLEPDHAEARRFLHYRRGKNGWRRESYRAPENRGSEPLAEYEARRAALVAGWRSALLALSERFESGLSADERERVWDDLLILAPDDEEARSHRGEARDPASAGSWVLRETVAARSRRARFESRARELAAAEPASARLDPAADEAAVGWKQALASEDVRLFGACEAEEAREVLHESQSAVTLFREVFDEAPGLPRDFTLYLLANEPAKRAFFEKHPLAGEAARECTGAWLANNDAVAIWHADKKRRSEQTLRETIRRMLSGTYGLGPGQAWATEGFALRLFELAAPRAELELAGPKDSDAPLRVKQERLWSTARNAVRSDGWSLAALLARPFAEFRSGDVLASYALACFLGEAHAEKLARLLDEVGRSGLSPVECLEGTLGTDLDTLERRFVRWANEVEP